MWKLNCKLNLWLVEAMDMETDKTVCREGYVSREG